MCEVVLGICVPRACPGSAGSRGDVGVVMELRYQWEKLVWPLGTWGPSHPRQPLLPCRQVTWCIFPVSGLCHCMSCRARPLMAESQLIMWTAHILVIRPGVTGHPVCLRLVFWVMLLDRSLQVLCGRVSLPLGSSPRVQLLGFGSGSLTSEQVSAAPSCHPSPRGSRSPCPLTLDIRVGVGPHWGLACIS